MDLKDIKAIIDLMKKNSISEFELEEKDSKIRLKRGLGSSEVSRIDSPPVLSPVPIAPVSGIASAPSSLSVSNGDIDIKSPMIGTFYRAPSPEAGSYVEIGTEVNAETVVCIIEAMKVMNEIKAEVKGVITQILIENGKPVEFGQPLFKVRPS